MDNLKDYAIRGPKRKYGEEKEILFREKHAGTIRKDGWKCGRIMWVPDLPPDDREEDVLIAIYRDPSKLDTE